MKCARAHLALTNSGDFAEVKGYVDQVEGYVDEVESKIDVLTLSNEGDLSEIKGYVDQVESNQANLLSEVDDAEEKLDEIYDRQTSLNYNVMTQLANVDIHVGENGEAIDDVQTTADELATDTEAILAELALIKQSINEIGGSPSNVVMDSTSFSFHAQTAVGLGERMRFSYDSIRHVSLSLLVGIDEGSHISIHCSVAGSVPQLAYILHWTDSGFNHLEFDTDEWYIFVGDNDGVPDVNCFVNVVTSEEA